MMVPARYADDFRGATGAFCYTLALLRHLLSWCVLAAEGVPDAEGERARLELEVRGRLFPAAWALTVDGWTRSVHRSQATADQARDRLLASRRYRWSAFQPAVVVEPLATQAEAFAARREARKIRGTRYGGPR